MIRAVLLLLCIAALTEAQVPGDAEAVSGFEQLIKSGRLTEAQSELRTYTAQHPKSWQAEYQLGYVDFQLHQIQSSVVHECKSLLLHEEFAQSHKILAYDLNMLGHPDRAIVELERSIKIDGSIAESHYELGRIQYEQGYYVQAILHLEKAKQLAPDFIRVYHNLGLAYAAVSEKEKAVSNFEEGLSRNEREAMPSAWPLIDYATYFNSQGMFEKARLLLQRAVAMDQRWDHAYDELSKADRGLGNLTDAIDDLQHAVAINGSKREYHYVLAQLYKQTKQGARAEQELAAFKAQRAGQ